MKGLGVFPILGVANRCTMDREGVAIVTAPEFHPRTK